MLFNADFALSCHMVKRLIHFIGVTVIISCDNVPVCPLQYTFAV